MPAAALHHAGVHAQQVGRLGGTEGDVQGLGVPAVQTCMKRTCRMEPHMWTGCILLRGKASKSFVYFPKLTAHSVAPSTASRAGSAAEEEHTGRGLKVDQAHSAAPCPQLSPPALLLLPPFLFAVERPGSTAAGGCAGRGLKVERAHSAAARDPQDPVFSFLTSLLIPTHSHSWQS